MIKLPVIKLIEINQMKKTNIYFLRVLAVTILFLMPIDTLAQATPELNEEFLNSLPSDVRDELLEQIEADKPNTKIDYGVFSTLINKNSAKDFIDQELLSLEDAEDPKEISLGDLRPFGEAFFSGYPSTFLPVTEPGLGSNYILSAGDTLSVNISGSIEIESELTITRMGNINIPKIGKLQLSGLTLNQANDKVKSFIQSRYVGSEVYITLSEVADIQVILSGFVEVPGIYTLSGGNSILGAIRSAGGISENGSYRNINLKRDGKIVANLDLYNLLLRGELGLDIPLQAGDVIHVEYLKKSVSIYGGVKQPAKFEVIDESLFDIIAYAGGSISNSELNSVSLASLDGTSYIAKDINSESFNSTKLQSNDIIFVPFFDISFAGFVDIEGGFIQNGRFALGSDLEFILSRENLANDSYPLAFLLKDYNQESKSSKWVLSEELQLSSLSEGDKVVALSNNDINFLNSRILKDFFTQPQLVGKYQNCKLFKNLYDLKFSSKFEEAKKVLGAYKLIDDGPTNSQFTDLKLDPNQAVLASNSNDAINTTSLFRVQKCSIEYSAFFDDDPESLIYLILNSVNIEGSSHKSGIFPASQTASLKKYIEYSHIFSNEDSPKTLYISNSQNTKAVDFNDADNIIIKPGYSINFPNKIINETNLVTISGAVKNPGKYFLSPNTRLSQLIKISGGLEDNAYAIGGMLHRESAKRIEEEYHQRLYDNLIQTLSTELTQGTAIPFEGLNLILKEFKSIRPSGRVIAEFNPSILSRNPSSDIILEKHDSIHIPARTNVVYVLGEVLTPGPQNYNADYNFQDYIERAGGFTEFVQKGAIIQILPNGESRRLKAGLFNEFFDSSSILPGTVIYATKDISKLNNLKLASTLAPVISSIAISLASLNSISNN